MSHPESDPSHSKKTYDVGIIGGGPAGLNAALVLGRARRNVLLCDAGSPRNIITDDMHGFITRDYTPPGELLILARAQLARYPTVEIVDARADGATALDSGFSLQIGAGEVAARKLILATGMIDALPPIKNLEKFWGKTVFTCPFCDGWEMRDRVIGICGESANLVSLAKELFQWSTRLTIFGFTADVYSGDENRWVSSARVATHKEPIVELRGSENEISAVVLGDGASVPCEALFLCVPLVQRSHLVEQLGCVLSPQGRIVVDEKQRTSIKGLFAAGDATAKVHQVIVAAASGATAAVFANDELTAEDADFLIDASAPAGPTS